MNTLRFPTAKTAIICQRQPRGVELGYNLRVLNTTATLHSSSHLIFIACVALVLNMTGFLPVAATLPDLFVAFELSESEAGWLTGSAFAAYAATVPFATALTDRVDAKPVVVVALVLSGLSGIGFGLFADDFWSAMGYRVLAGIGFGAMHFPGLKMLADRLPADRTARASGLYVSMFSLGGAASFAVAGAVMLYADWRAVFIVTGLCSGVGALIISFAVSALAHPHDGGQGLPEFKPVIENRAAMRYVVSYFGHIWEMFSFRSWFVVFMVLSTTHAHNQSYQSWNVPVLAALTSLVAWPAGLLVSELSQRFARNRVITGTVLASLLLCLVLAGSANISTPVLLALMMLFSMTAFADSTALASGLVVTVPAAVRGAALALYALFGFVGGAIGPAVVGWVMELFGGRHDPQAWVAAWLTIGAGTLVVLAALNLRSRAATT